MHSAEKDVRSLLVTVLREARGPVSGAELARRLGVSRTAVWKHVEALRRLGYRIAAQRGSGYALEAAPDLLLPEEILPMLRGRLGRPYHHHAEIDSTNLELRRLAMEGAPEGTTVVADLQTRGRGRRGRSWTAPPGTALNASVLLRPDRQARDAGRLTLLTAVAARRAILEASGLDAGIKWPNDLLLGGRKCCGILLELAAQQDAIEFVVVGVGINVNQTTGDFGPELAATATSLRLAAGREVARAPLLAALLAHLEAVYEGWLQGADAPLLDEWRAACVHLGRPVQVLAPHGTVTGTAVDVADDGELLVRDGAGRLLRVVAGEVSLRPA